MENRGVNRNYKMARRFLSFFLVLGVKSNIKQLKGTLTKDKALKVGQKAPHHSTPSRARLFKGKHNAQGPNKRNDICIP